MNSRRNVFIAVAIAVIAVLFIAGCRSCTRPPAPPPAATVTPTVTRTPPRPTVTAPPVEITATLSIPPTATPVPAETDTPEPYPVATITPLPTIALRGVHRVVPGDTYWGVACRWYADIPLLPGANPLTPCTCWPGIYWTTTSGLGNPPQLIFPGERLFVPQECGQ